ncbi:hypothetical protein [Paenibacillus sp. GCM10027626]|uniref:hypothetical protein n=1 Tax=Paenibacillus sp. GCM10027626 TaxID=3273411 RepID=UPI00362618EB
MDDKLKQMMEQLDAEETEKLLSSEMMMKADAKAARRIKALVHEKAGFKPVRRRRLWYRLTAAAAIILLLLGSLVSFGGVQTVADAIGKLFGFVPGHGIVDPAGGLLYRMSAAPKKAENDDYILTLQNATATNSSISVNLLIEKRGAAPIITSEDKEAALRSAAANPKVSLLANGKRYDVHGWTRGIGKKYYTVSGDFTLPVSEMPENTIYTMAVENLALSVDFQLIRYDSYISLEEIGPTVYRKHLSVTAVSERVGNQLNVELYPLHDLYYKPYSFIKDKYNKALTGDVHLRTTKGERSYVANDEPYTSPLTRFSFNLAEDEQPIALEVPHVTLNSSESAKITLPVPKMNEKQPINKTVDFRDATAKIVSVERVMHQDENSGNSFDALKISLQYTNKQEDLKLNWVYLDGVNTGGFGWEFNEAGEAATYYYSLANYDRPTIELELKEPQYRLTEGISIKLDQKKRLTPPLE